MKIGNKTFIEFNTHNNRPIMIAIEEILAVYEHNMYPEHTLIVLRSGDYVVTHPYESVKQALRDLSENYF